MPTNRCKILDFLVFRSIANWIRNLNYKEYHITSLIQRLNSDKKDGIVTEIRLCRAQLMLNLTEPIWLTNRDIPINMHLIKHNIAVTEFIAGHSIDMGIMCINQEINF